MEESDRDSYIEIMKDELNVKNILCFPEAHDVDSKIVQLDIHIDIELKREGDYRDLLRSVQELRKNTGLNPGEKAILSLPEMHKEIVEPFMTEIKKAANLVDVIYIHDGEMTLQKV